MTSLTYDRSLVCAAAGWLDRRRHTAGALARCGAGPWLAGRGRGWPWLAAPALLWPWLALAAACIQVTGAVPSVTGISPLQFSKFSERFQPRFQGYYIAPGTVEPEPVYL